MDKQLLLHIYSIEAMLNCNKKKIKQYLLFHDFLNYDSSKLVASIMYVFTSSKQKLDLI